MEGSKHDDLRRQLKEYEAENRGLREQLEQAESEIDRLRGEKEQLRKELKAAGRGPKHGTNSRKRERPDPGRAEEVRGGSRECLPGATYRCGRSAGGLHR